MSVDLAQVKTLFAVLQWIVAAKAPEPSFECASDGSLALDWQLDRDAALSINIYPSGEVGYSLLNGDQHGYGRLLAEELNAALDIARDFFAGRR